MDFDIQKSEVRAIPAGIDEMTRKVRRVFVETHGHQIHELVRRSFATYGFKCPDF